MVFMFRSLNRILREKRGSSTMEYVVILAVGALLATLLFQVFQGDEVKNAIRAAVEDAILGELAFDPGEDTNDSREGNRHFSDVPDPVKIPEPVVDSNKPSGDADPSNRTGCPIPMISIFWEIYFPWRECCLKKRLIRVKVWRTSPG